VHAPLTVEEAFKIISRAVELDKVDRVRVISHDVVVVGRLRVYIEVEVLVEEDIARRDVMEHRCVALAISQLAHVLVAVLARHKSVVGIVLDLERELNGFTVVGHVVISEGLHGHAAEEVGQRGDCVGDTAQGGGRLNCIIEVERCTGQGQARRSVGGEEHGI
jgi:hypothetical protein